MPRKLAKGGRVRSQVLGFFGLLAMVSAVVWIAARGAGEPSAQHYRIRVKHRFPHDSQAFTQGLLYFEGALFESTGQYGESTVRRVHLETGEVEIERRLPDDVFAEGLARIGDRLIQLSWREGKAFVWDRATLELLEEHDYPGEGWGLCYDGERLVMSSGTDRLVFRDPRTFRKLGEVRVRDGTTPVRDLNELACVNGEVYANVWTRDALVRVDPDTGRVTGWIDATNLLPEDDREGNEDVLNGIAYIPSSGHFLLTGKNWPYLYEVEFVPTD